MEQSYYDSNQYNTNTTNSMAPRNIRNIKAAARGQLLGNYSPIIGCGLLLFLIQQILGSVFSNMLMIRPGAVQYIIYYAAMIIISMLVIFFQAGLYRMHLNAAAGQPVTSKDLAFAVRHNPNRFLISGLILTLISFLFQIPESILSLVKEQKEHFRVERLKFIGSSVKRPVISDICHVDGIVVNILGATVQELQENVMCVFILQLIGAEEKILEAEKQIDENGVIRERVEAI